ncbi:transmembrane protein 163a-like [Tubulanus polymorphus]|uniref:transmembrane protein 163a-like n=1 Tax=Tubulanus polymorphus TaxID=672921 RepID=UPI003DA41251
MSQNRENDNSSKVDEGKGAAAVNEGDEKSEKGDRSKSEKDQLIRGKSRHKLDTKGADQMRVAALIVSYTSIVVTLVIGIFTLVLAIFDNSAASYAFAINSFMDCFTSAVVLWRFHSKEKDMYASKREVVACIILGVLFLLSFLSTFIKSLHDLIVQVHTARDANIWHLSLINAILCFVLAGMKLFIGYKIESAAMVTDALNSFIGFIIGLAIVISSIEYDENTSIWYLDSVVGLVCSIVILVYGVKLLVVSQINYKNLGDNANETVPMVTKKDNT